MSLLDDTRDNLQDTTNDLEDRYQEKHGEVEDFHDEPVMQNDTMAEDGYDVNALDEDDEEIVQDETTGDPLPDRYIDQDHIE